MGNLKILWKLGLPTAALGLASITAVALNHPAKSSPSLKASDSTTQPAPDITVNGQAVEVAPGNSKTVQSDGATANVSVSSSSQATPATTSVQTNNGNVSVTVSQSSQNSSSFSSTNVSSFSSSHNSQNNSNLNVSTGGSANVSISN